MSECLMVNVSPQVTIMFQGDKAVRAFTAKLTVKENTSSAMIKFTNREINRMSEPFRSNFKRNGGIASILKTVNGNENLYLIRYCKHGYNISVSDSDLKTAKEIFIKS